MSGFLARLSGTTTVMTTCEGQNHSPSSAILSSTAEPAPALDTVLSVWGIQRFPPPHEYVSSWTEKDEECILLNNNQRFGYVRRDTRPTALTKEFLDGIIMSPDATGDVQGQGFDLV